jgi:5-methylcytosine-specific restriction enzyme subunit McrC
MTVDDQHVRLDEQAFCSAVLPSEDMHYLSRLGFQVLLDSAQADPDLISCQVNPGSMVGHFRAPSGRMVVVTPKIDTAAVIRMLAYVYSDKHRTVFFSEQVNFASDRLLFEPLVELFNSLVSTRAGRGLVQDYVQREENLGSFKGALDVRAHLQENIGRDNRIHCRFFEQTVDVPDNRLVKTTIFHLAQAGGWTTTTDQSLLHNLHQFDAVTLERIPERLNGTGHYHRLNDDYLPIHELCRMFLSCMSISEDVGGFAFRGFLLDMNLLFELFVQKAFKKILSRGSMRPEIQRPRNVSLNTIAPLMRPDVVVREADAAVVVADAKYKRDEGGPRNPDIYQVITYGTVLQCDRVFLVYPSTELDSEHDFPIINSRIVVKIRRVDISTEDCVSDVEALAREIVADGTTAMPSRRGGGRGEWIR